ncbi:MAG: GAF domain-containing sensor histidine kinase [Myxococcota bacterium]
MTEPRPPSRELDAIARLSDALFSASDPEALIARALATAIEELSAESGSILIAAPERSTLVFRYSMGDQPVAAGTEIPWNQGIAGAVFQSGRARVISNVKLDPQHLGTIDERVGHATRDLASVPLKRFGGAAVGVINVLNKRSGTFDAEDLALLTVLGALTASALEGAQRYEEAKLAEVARAIGDIGHDLKNLLTPVLSSAGLLGEELESLFSRPDLAELELSRELCTEAIGLIQRTGERIHHRVKEISDCVKGRTAEPNFARCDLSAVARDVVATLGVLAKSRQIALTLEGWEAPIWTIADANRLYSALYNLVDNALPEVSPGGQVRLVRGEQGPDRVEIAVIDDGRGMEPEVRDRLFTAGALSTKRGGSGLGTRIAHDAVLVHGGSISVQSAPGQGTQIRILLPLRSA